MGGAHGTDATPPHWLGIRLRVLYKRYDETELYLGLNWGNANTMLYALICIDKPGEGLALRQQNREKHLGYLRDMGDRIKSAGPFVGEDGSPCGSLIILEAETLDEARSIASGDPYAQAGVFERVDIYPWKWVLGATNLA